MEQAGGRIVERVRRWPRRVVITVAAVVLVLVAVRLSLPYVVRHQINERLRDIPGYRGHVDHVTLGLLRGAYTLNALSIVRLNGEQEVPFFVVRTMDISIAWRDLFRGRIVSDIHLEQPELTIVAAPTPESSQKDTDSRWRQVVRDIVPIDIQYFTVKRGLVRYIDETRNPPVDLFLTDMTVIATGLRNRPADVNEEFPARIDVQGDSLGGGRLALLVQAEPLADKPHFHLSLKLSNVNLPDLNESLRAVANVDVSRGTFEMVLEMAGKDGAFQGYVKPFFNDLDFKVREDREGSLAAHLWEKILSGLAWLVKNRPRDQVATRIPFQGEFGDSQFGLWATIRNLFRHGFVRAFNPVVEGSIDPDNVPPPSEIAPGKADDRDEKRAQRKLEKDADAAAAGGRK